MHAKVIRRGLLLATFGLFVSVSRGPVDAQGASLQLMGALSTGVAACSAGDDLLVVDPGPAPNPVLRPVQESDPVIVAAPRPTRDQVLEYRGLLANIRDAQGRIIWTPALPGAPADVRADWLARLAAAGATHVPIGPFNAGTVYPGVEWGNPDWSRDASAIRGLLLEILATPSASGAGFVPVIFLDGGAADPESRLAVIRPTLSAALEGIGPHTITVPCGWESYEWRPLQCADAEAAWFPMRQGSVMAWHGYRGRSSGASSDPYNTATDDPWLDGPIVEADGRTARYGSWLRFWGDTRFEMFLYQSHPIRTMREATCDGQERPPYSEGCWKNRFQDVVARIGAGICSNALGVGPVCGPGRRRFVFFEATAYFEFREWAEAGVSVEVATAARGICERFGVSCGFGNGLPR